MPFGPRAAPPGILDAPPSAADFWGERSASIHDALQAPADDEAGVPGAAAGVPAPARIPARGRRRFAVAASLALAAVTFVVVVVGLSGPSSREAGGPRVNMAAVLSSSLSRILESGLAHLDVKAASTHAAVDQHRARPARSAQRARPVIKRVYDTVRYQASPPVTYPVSASADASAAPAVTTIHQPTLSAASTGTTETTSPPTRPAAPPASVHAARSSPAAVSPTGQSGALGPIQSPNG